MPSYNHIKEEIENDKYENKTETEIKKIIFDNKLVLKNIKFSYPNSSLNTLKNISLEINKGDKVGIVGKSGTGKTTLVSVILGLIKPDFGKIIIDDTEIDFSKYEWNSVGYVPQKFFY